ncbi:hypothetical protein DFP72DRAFT_907001 [Ephemerocybe angulata]|uniref:Uncharacterized protein n=1 Tax=Ephemerocybe angulata TaxID=980116 RepID=A0A8H6HRB0_9AGAR|nr:hypothetical protein DFP72DRAFT_907001 [Tulosesus angulatus]
MGGRTRARLGMPFIGVPSTHANATLVEEHEMDDLASDLHRDIGMPEDGVPTKTVDEEGQRERASVPLNGAPTQVETEENGEGLGEGTKALDDVGGPIDGAPRERDVEAGRREREGVPFNGAPAEAEMEENGERDRDRQGGLSPRQKKMIAQWMLAFAAGALVTGVGSLVLAGVVSYLQSRKKQD